MAKIISISNSKGGVGKSTLALNLYQYLSGQGASCAICDLDYQKSITKLGRNINLVSIDDLPSAQGVRICLVDTPPYQDNNTAKIFDLSDFILIPLKASVFDLQAAGYAISLAQESGKPWGLVLNMVKPGTNFVDQVKGKINQLGLPLLKTEIHDRISYARALLFDDGLGVEGNQKANTEISDLANEILTRLI